MPEEPRLLLYVGEDFLLPTVFNSNGTACSSREESSGYYWLYFHGSDNPDYSYQYKLPVANHTPGYFGNFLDNCAQGQKISIGGAQCNYFDLMRYSGMLDTLRELYANASRENAGPIPTAYVFAECIPDSQRKTFIENMSNSRFVPVAHSVLLTEVVMRFVMRDNAGLHPTLGDKALLLNAVCDKLLLSHAVFDGEQWMSDGSCEVVSDFGDAPVKDALVRYVIRTIDNHNSFLHTEALKNEEFAFQRKNADKWLGLQRTEGGTIHISDFRYKDIGDQAYACSVPVSVLNREIESSLNRVFSSITSYVRDHIGSHLSQLVLMGTAFDDRDLVERMVPAIGSPVYRVITTSMMPSVFERYQADFGDVRDDFAKYDLEMLKLTRTRRAVTTWGKLAADIRDLRLHIIEAARNLDEAVKDDGRKLENAMELCDSHLRVSEFGPAREKIRNLTLPSTATANAISKANSFANEAASNQLEFEKLKDIPGASGAIADIEAQRERINDLIRTSDGYKSALEAKKGKIDFYEANYGEYVRLKNRFLLPDLSFAERKEIRGSMADLTMEPLPELSLPHVNVDLVASVSVVKKGLFCKDKVVRVEFTVIDGNALPCDAVLNISASMMYKATYDSCIRVDVPKGTKTFAKDFVIKDEPILKSAKAVYVCLFADEKQIDTECILNKSGLDKPYERLSLA